MSNDLHDRWSGRASTALFAAIALLIAWDLWVDYGDGASPGHLAVELLVLAVATGGIVLILQQHMRTRADLSQARLEAERWRAESRELIRGLAVAIEKQFDRWQLTRAEAEVGLLLLKGLSHKEIAGVRNTSERTAREQARALYRKSSLPGRQALSAFFLEDLLLPQGREPETRRPGSTTHPPV